METGKEFFDRISSDIDSKIEREKEKHEQEEYMLSFLKDNGFIVKTKFVGRLSGLQAYKVKRYINIWFLKIPVKDYYSKFSLNLFLLFTNVLEEMKRRGEIS